VREVWIVALAVVWMSVAIAAQKPPAATAAAAPPAADASTYDAGGRRDPFVSIVAAVAEVRVAPPRAAGAAGLAIGEMSVRGVILSQGALIAMVEGPDKKTYLVHQGDQLYDGRVKTITAQGLVIVQQVSDPLSPVKQREIRKQLRSAEDAKP